MKKISFGEKQNINAFFCMHVFHPKDICKSTIFNQDL